MIHTRCRTWVFAALLAALQLACEAETQDLSQTGPLILAHDNAAERRVLQIALSSAEPAECMQARIPIGDSVVWRENLLDPTVHRRLIALISDPSRHEAYRADTEFAVSIELEQCADEDGLPTPEPCELEEFRVAGAGEHWRFSLENGVTISDAAQELIDEFLAAHTTCWKGRQSIP